MLRPANQYRPCWFIRAGKYKIFNNPYNMLFNANVLYYFTYRVFELH